MTRLRAAATITATILLPLGVLSVCGTGRGAGQEPLPRRTTPGSVPGSPRATPPAGPAVLEVRPWADDRPVGWISTHGVRPTAANPEGWNRHLRNPQRGYRWLYEQLTGRPWTRFLIHQPAGWQEGVGAMGGSHYWTLSETQRDMYCRAIHDAMRDRPQITVGIYGGINFKWTHSREMDGWYVVDFDNGRDRWAVWQQSVAPWIRAGAYEYWFDNGAALEKRPDALAFCRWLMAAQFVHAGIESFPTFRATGQRLTLDKDALTQAPALGNLRFIQSHDPDRSWDVRDCTYEAIALVHRTIDDEPPELDLLLSLLDRGFVLGAHERFDDLVLEAYVEHQRRGRQPGRR